MTTTTNDDLIEAFWQSRLHGIYFPPAYFGKLTIDQSYRVQLGLIERRRAAGERQIGWKVGLTAPAIQRQFGFHEPVFGCVLDSKPSGHVFAPTELIAPGFENELCMRLRVDLSGPIGLDAGPRRDRRRLPVTGDHRDTRAVHRADRTRAGG